MGLAPRYFFFQQRPPKSSTGLQGFPWGAGQTPPAPFQGSDGFYSLQPAGTKFPPPPKARLPSPPLPTGADNYNPGSVVIKTLQGPIARLDLQSRGGGVGEEGPPRHQWDSVPDLRHRCRQGRGVEKPAAASSLPGDLYSKAQLPRGEKESFSACTRWAGRTRDPASSSGSLVPSFCTLANPPTPSSS